MPLLYERLRDFLLDEIQSGRLQPGDRVPSEAELSSRFNVSRITSKKALETLQADGVVVRSRGRGSFVAERSSGQPPISPVPGTTPAPTRTTPDRHPQIGFIVPNLSGDFGLRMLAAIEARAAERGYQLVLRRTMGQRAQEIDAITSFVRAGISGLIVFPIHGEYYNDELLRIVLDGFPVVLIDRFLKGIAVSSVCTDNYAAARQLTTSLIDRGHTRLAFFSPPPERTTSIEDRRRGFSAALRDRGLPVTSDQYVMTLSSTLPGTRFAELIPHDAERIRTFFRDHPDITACVACEYVLALLIDHSVRTARITPPPEIACFDSPEDPFNEYRFSHVRQDESQMGSVAVDLLVDQIENGAAPSHQVLDFALIERQPVVSGGGYE